MSACPVIPVLTERVVDALEPLLDEQGLDLSETRILWNPRSETLQLRATITMKEEPTSPST